MTEDETQITNNIVSCRKRTNITQSDLAVKMGVSVRTIINAENHPFNCKYKFLNDMAKAIGCNINEFFLPLKFTNSENLKKQT